MKSLSRNRNHFFAGQRAALYGLMTSLVLVVALILPLGSVAVAGASTQDSPVDLADSGYAASGHFLRTEYLVMGAAASGGTLAVLAADDKPVARSDEFGWGEAKDEGNAEGTRNLGRKVKASLLSAVLPGAGQWYVGDRRRAYLMGGVEAGIWGAYLVFDNMGDNWRDSAIDYAGVYAGTGGSHNDAYWITVGTYMDSDAYDDARMREARALQEPYPDPTSPADSWQWVNNDRRQGYWKLWGDAHDSYDRRDYMLAFALVNRVVSMVDAVLGVDRMDGRIGTSLLGMEVELAVIPALPDPEARWSFSRRF